MRRCLSGAAFVLLWLVASSAASAQTVDEIVAKYVQAKGGADKWKSITSVKMTGRISVQGKELPLTVYAKRPNLNRQEISLMQDQRMIQAFDGTTGWTINPMTGSDAPQVLPAPATEMMRNSADFDGALFDYKSKGHTVELVGKEKLGATEVYHLKVTMKGGHVQHYYLDAATGLELKTTAEVDIGTGQKQPLETEMSNHQQVSGISIPHTIRQTINGKMVVQMDVDKVEFNTVADDTVFRMPKK